MLAISSIPRAFEGQFGAIQKFAIASWLDIRYVNDIYLYHEYAEDIPALIQWRPRNVVHYLLCDMHANYDVALARTAVRHLQDVTDEDDYKLFVSTDVLLFDGIMRAFDLATWQFEQFVLVGRRANWDNPYIEDNVGHDCLTVPMPVVRERAVKEATPWNNDAVDYIGWRGTIWPWCNMPDFMVGRGGYDHWLIWAALQEGIPVIDATGTILAIHQNHGPIGKRSSKPGATVEQMQYNKGLMPVERCGIEAATWIMDSEGLRRK